MTFAMTSDVDDAHPSGTDLELTSANDAARYVGDNCLNDGPVGLVVLEIEAHCFDLADPMRRPDWSELTDTIASGKEAHLLSDYLTCNGIAARRRSASQGRGSEFTEE